MKKLELVCFTKNNEVIKISAPDDNTISNSLHELIEHYSLNSISEFDSLEEMILELHSLGVNTTILNIDINISDLLDKEE